MNHIEVLIEHRYMQNSLSQALITLRMWSLWLVWEWLQWSQLQLLHSSPYLISVDCHTYGSYSRNHSC